MAHPHSDANWVMPIISQLILTIATSSASPELRFTFFWVADHVLRVCRPLRTAPPLVLLAVFLQPAKSESVYPASSPGASRNSKLQTFWVAPDEVAPKPPQSTEVTSGGVAHLPAYLLDRVLDVRAVQGEVVGPRQQRTVLVVQALAVLLLLLPTLLILLLVSAPTSPCAKSTPSR